jgi:hypothetical protein
MIHRIRMARKRLMVARQRESTKWTKSVLSGCQTHPQSDGQIRTKKLRWERAEWNAITIMRRKDPLA